MTIYRVQLDTLSKLILPLSGYFCKRAHQEILNYRQGSHWVPDNSAEMRVVLRARLCFREVDLPGGDLSRRNAVLADAHEDQGAQEAREDWGARKAAAHMPLNQGPHVCTTPAHGRATGFPSTTGTSLPAPRSTHRPLEEEALPQRAALLCLEFMPFLAIGPTYSRATVFTRLLLALTCATDQVFECWDLNSLCPQALEV